MTIAVKNACDAVFLIYFIPKSFLDIKFDDTIDDLVLDNIDTVQEFALKEGDNIVDISVIGDN